MATKRRSDMRLAMACLPFLAGFILGACGDRASNEPVPTSTLEHATSEPTGATDLTVADEAAIYAAVISALYARRGDSVGGVDAPVLYLDKRVQGSGSLEPDDAPPPPQPLDEAAQGRILAALPDLPARLVWVDRRSEVPFVTEPQPGADNGAVISLSHIDRRADGSALVAAALSFNCNCELGGGSHFVVQRLDNRWQVTGEEAAWES